MDLRISMTKTAPEAARPLYELSAYVEKSGLEPLLLELVKIRASQINGCAFCLDMHAKDARALGESEERLYLLDAWRESPNYSARERAALAWCEALTRVSEDHVPDAVYQEARGQFSEKELVDLSMAIVLINAWNRLMIAFGAPPGKYRSRHAKAAV